MIHRLFSTFLAAALLASAPAQAQTAKDASSFSYTLPANSPFASPASPVPHSDAQSTPLSENAPPVAALETCEQVYLDRDPHHRSQADFMNDTSTNWRSTFLANVAECYYARKDYIHVTGFYQEIRSIYDNNEPLINYDDNAHDISLALLLDHIALSYEKMGDLSHARLAIRDADLNNGTNLINDKEVNEDFHRLDKVHILAKQKQDKIGAIAAKKANDKSVQQQITDISQQARIAEIAYSKNFPAGSDMRKVARNNGRPCRVSYSDNSLGHLEIWWYGCYNSGGIGNETYTFRNGVLSDHSQY